MDKPPCQGLRRYEGRAFSQTCRWLSVIPYLLWCLTLPGYVGLSKSIVPLQDLPDLPCCWCKPLLRHCSAVGSLILLELLATKTLPLGRSLLLEAPDSCLFLNLPCTTHAVLLTGRSQPSGEASEPRSDMSFRGFPWQRYCSTEKVELHGDPSLKVQQQMLLMIFLHIISCFSNSFYYAKYKWNNCLIALTTWGRLFSEVQWCTKIIMLTSHHCIRMLYLHCYWDFSITAIGAGTFGTKSRDVTIKSSSNTTGRTMFSRNKSGQVGTEICWNVRFIFNNFL